jgi:hypothetical protein
VRRAARRQEGASAVEFALVLPILVLFVFGIIEFGFAFFRAQGMEAAAREGGRVAAIGLPGDDIYNAVIDGVGLVPIDSGDVEVCVVDGSGDPSAGDCATSAAGLAAIYEGCGEAPGEQRVRVDARVTAPSKYSIRIPGLSAIEQRYSTEAIFRCEVLP